MKLIITKKYLIMRKSIRFCQETRIIMEAKIMIMTRRTKALAFIIMES